MNTPSLRELEQKNISRANSVFGELEPQGKGIIETMARWRAGIEHSAYGMINWHMHQMFPDTAEDKQLYRLLTWRAIEPRSGQKALGTAQVRGLVNSVVLAGTGIRTEQGARYQVKTDARLSSTVQSIEIVALEVGSQANGENLPAEFESAIIGMEPQVLANATGGMDDETDEEYRLRALETIKNRGTRYGKVGDYAAWARLGSSEVGHAWEVPDFESRGALGIVVVSNSYEAVSNGALENVRTYIEEVKQAGVYFQVVQGQAKVFDFRLAITVESGADPEKVQIAVQNALNTYIKREEHPATHIALADIQAYIAANVAKLTSLAILAPTQTLVCGEREVPRLGTVSWQ